MNVSKECETQIVLGNAVELSAAIIRGVLGNEVSDSITGVDLTDAALVSMINARIQTRLGTHLGEV